MSVRIRFDESMGKTLQSQVTTWCERELKGQLELPSADKLRLDAATISGVASAIIAAITLLIEFRRDREANAEKRQWDADRLLASTKTALLQHGIIDFDVKEIVEFEKLNTPNSGLCRVDVVNTRTKTNYRVLVFNDGDAYVLRLEDLDV